VLGCSAPRGTTVTLPSENNGDSEITVTQDTVFLDTSLLEAKNEHSRQFTFAHECAHHILARLEEKRAGIHYRSRFDASRPYTARELKTVGDWCEWQANALAAVLLIPKSSLSPYLKRWGKPHKLTSYGGFFNTSDYAIICKLMKHFRVSDTVVKIRLKETGHLLYKPESELCDPLDVFAG
jgi:Zn-dependent peptidase ImmA (M78 family)